MIRQMKHDEEDEVRRLLVELSHEDQTLWRKQTKPLEECLQKYSQKPVKTSIEAKDAIFVAEEKGKMVDVN